MKIGVTTFKESVGRVAKAASSMSKRKLEQGRQITQGEWSATMRIIFSVEEQCIYIFATNGGVVAYDKIDVQTTDRDEEFTVYIYPVHLLDHLSLASGEVELRKYRDGVQIVLDGKQKFYLKSQDDYADFFLSFDRSFDTGDVQPIEINAIDLKDSLDFTAYVASGDRTEDKVVLIENVNGRLCFGATDSWRLAIARDILEVDRPVRSIVYREFINILSRMIEYEDVNIKLYFMDNALYFKDADFFAGALTTQSAHDIWGFLDKIALMDMTSIFPDTDLLKKAISTASHFAENGSGYVLIDMNKDTSRISAISNEIGSTFWDIETEITGKENMKVAFNPSALTEFFTHSKTKSVVMKFSEPQKPFLITGDNPNNSLIVMPVRVGDDLPATM